MRLRADHVAGAFFVMVGALVIALSGDLPFGDLAMPGAGFLPYIIAVLIVLFGTSLFLRAKESPAFSEIAWDDGKHAAQVLVIAGIAVAFYAALGFIVTMSLMMIALLLVIERKNMAFAVVYSAVVVVVTYLVFVHLLQSPLPPGIIGYI
jgi:hypothetical protein